MMSLKTGQSNDFIICDITKWNIRNCLVRLYNCLCEKWFFLSIFFSVAAACLQNLSCCMVTSHHCKHEPSHDETNKMSVRPAKTQISLGICPVWSESSLCAQWVAKDPSFLHADSEDWSDWANAQADLSLRWAHPHFVGFVMSWLKILLGC